LPRANLLRTTHTAADDPSAKTDEN